MILQMKLWLHLAQTHNWHKYNCTPVSSHNRFPELVCVAALVTWPFIGMWHFHQSLYFGGLRVVWFGPGKVFGGFKAIYRNWIAVLQHLGPNHWRIPCQAPRRIQMGQMSCKGAQKPTKMQNVMCNDVMCKCSGPLPPRMYATPLQCGHGELLRNIDFRHWQDSHWGPQRTWMS